MLMARVCSLASLGGFGQRWAAAAPPANQYGRRRRESWSSVPSSRQPPARHTWHAAAAAGEAAGVQPEVQPRLPLAERPPEHSAPLQSVLAWRQAALEAVAAVGDSWAAADGGPSGADLQTELSWLLDDAVAGVSSGSGGSGGDGGWQNATWRALERDAASGPDSGGGDGRRLVRLREPLPALEALWRERLERRTPLQYLTSAAYWRDVVLSVGPGVLIPRPETELVLDFVAEAVAAAPGLSRGTWVDLGTGSGALAVGLARAMPAVPRVWAVDLSPVPAAYAAYNAARLGVGGRVATALGSWYEPLRALGVAQVAGIVSNPPYIAAPVLPGLQVEVGR